MKKHLAIFSKEDLEVLFSGKKTIELRLSQKKIPPFLEASAGDLVYIKARGADIKGQFIIKKVIYFESLEAKDWELIKSHYWDRISLGSKERDEKFLRSHEQAKYATLIFLENIEQFITPPITFKKSDQRGWVVVGK